MKNQTRKSAVQAAIDLNIRGKGGDDQVINVCVSVGLVCLENNYSGASAVEYAGKVGNKILAGGASC